MAAAVCLGRNSDRSYSALHWLLDRGERAFGHDRLRRRDILRRGCLCIWGGQAIEHGRYRRQEQCPSVAFPFRGIICSPSLGCWPEGGSCLGFPTPYFNRLSRETILDGLLSHKPGVVTFVPEAGHEPPHVGRLLAILWVRSGLRDVAQIGVRGSRATIGRDPGNDVMLASPAVDACHAQLSLARGVWTLTDLGSANGTWVDRVRIEESLALAPGSEVRIADVVLNFAPRDEWSDSPIPPPPAAPALTGPLFRPSEDASESPRLVIRAAVVLGVCLLAYLLLAVR